MIQPDPQHKILTINKLMPAACVMTGGQLTQTRAMFDLLQIDTQGGQWTKITVLDKLGELTNDMWENEKQQVIEQLGDTFEIQLLEQLENSLKA